MWDDRAGLFWLEHLAGFEHHPDLSSCVGQGSPPNASLRGQDCTEDGDMVPSALLTSHHAPTWQLILTHDPAALQTQGLAQPALSESCDSATR